MLVNFVKLLTVGMKSKNIFLITTIAAAVAVIFYTSTNEDGTGYNHEIIEERKSTDRFMRTSTQSPFAGANESFKGLQYYPPDINYRIIAGFEPIEQKRTRMLATSDGAEQHYREYGYAVFTLEGIENRLLILESIIPGPLQKKLFLAFGDETTARETYGAGRYLDVSHTPGASTITLDFNKAYNPYCAYNDTFSCPLPPAENLLNVAIRAGEKSYH